MAITLASLARYFKRLKEWEAYAEEIEAESFRLQLLGEVRAMKELLTQCWERQSVTDDDTRQIQDVERKLEQLFEEQRFLKNIR